MRGCRLGDFIDIVAILTSLMSVCSKAGLSTQLVNDGLADSFPGIIQEEDQRVQVQKEILEFGIPYVQSLTKRYHCPLGSGPLVTDPADNSDDPI